MCARTIMLGKETDWFAELVGGVCSWSVVSAVGELAEIIWTSRAWSNTAITRKTPGSCADYFS